MRIPPELVGRAIGAKVRNRREFRILAGLSLFVGISLFIAAWRSGLNGYTLFGVSFATMALTVYLMYRYYLLDTLSLILDQQGVVCKIGKRVHRLHWEELCTVKATWLGLPAFPLKPTAFPAWRMKLNYGIVRLLGMSRKNAFAYVEQLPRRDARKVRFLLQGQQGQRLIIIPDEFESPFDRLLKEWLWSVWQERTMLPP